MVMMMMMMVFTWSKYLQKTILFLASLAWLLGAKSESSSRRIHICHCIFLWRGKLPGNNLFDFLIWTMTVYKLNFCLGTMWYGHWNCALLISWLFSYFSVCIYDSGICRVSLSVSGRALFRLQETWLDGWLFYKLIQNVTKIVFFVPSWLSSIFIFSLMLLGYIYYLKIGKLNFSLHMCSFFPHW